jgi:hypothetical protein
MEHPRRTPRYLFGAPAELIVEHSDAKMLVRVKELSLHGCYLDTSIPLSTETPACAQQLPGAKLMEVHAPTAKSFSWLNRVLAMVGVVWLLAVTAGLRAMLNYEDGPAEPGQPPTEWPKGSTISRKLGMPTVVMFVHPKCPCTDATIGELSILMTRLQGKATAAVFFVRPANFPDAWEKTELWHNAEAMAHPGVKFFSP